MVSMPHPKKKRTGRRKNHGIEIMTARKTEMSGKEVGTAAGQSEMEAQSAAAGEMNQRAHATGLKMQPPHPGLRGRRRTVAMAPPDAPNGSHPPQHLPLGTQSGATGRPLVSETGLSGANTQMTLLFPRHRTNTMNGPMTEGTWGPLHVCPGAEEDGRMVKKEFHLTQKRSGSSGRMTRGKLTGTGT